MATYNLFHNSDLFEDKHFRENNSENKPFSICLKNGVLTAALLIMSSLALCYYTKLLGVNQLAGIHIFLLLIGVYYSLEEYSPTGKGDSIDYFEGFKIGLFTSVISIAIYALFTLLFTFFSPDVLHGAQADFFQGLSSGLTVAGVALFEGLAESLIVTFSLMQYFKKNDLS